MRTEKQMKGCGGMIKIRDKRENRVLELLQITLKSFTGYDKGTHKNFKGVIGQAEDGTKVYLPLDDVELLNPIYPAEIEDLAGNNGSDNN